jgi:hypothetical protein
MCDFVANAVKYKVRTYVSKPPNDSLHCFIVVNNTIASILFHSPGQFTSIGERHTFMLICKMPIKSEVRVDNSK